MIRNIIRKIHDKWILRPQIDKQSHRRINRVHHSITLGIERKNDLTTAANRSGWS
jgi:hypothetical protein